MIGFKKKSEGDKENPIEPEIIDRIKIIDELSGLPKNHFDQFYKEPIERFTVLTRHCKCERVVAHLDKVIHSLRLRRSIVLPLASDAECINAQKDIWTYAIFVASMTFRVSELLSYHVLLGSDGQRNNTRWCPFDEPFDTSLHVLDEQRVELTPHADLLFLSRLFSRTNLIWLYRNPEAFNATLLLSVKPDRRTELGRIILDAHGVCDTNEKDNPINIGSSIVKNSSSVQSVANTTETSLANDKRSNDKIFSAWLADAIQSASYGKLICKTKNGYGLSDPNIFIHYAKHNGGDWKSIKSEFLDQVGKMQKVNKMHFEGAGTFCALILPNSVELNMR